MEEERKPKQIMEGRGGKGRSRVTYNDNINEIARRRGMGELTRMAKERDE